ncbi:alpha-methylacyl-CoA racemase [Microdochium nivale]|nr:alpha-methylacyl-CoA racemase [Microdochium nivale]
MTLLKLSILFFFLRIFPDRNFRRVVWVTVALVCAYGVAFVVTAAFQCWPFSYNWTQWNDRGGGGKCIDYAALAWANAAASIVLDLWILYLPFSQILALKLHWKKKLGIAAMFTVGTFVTVISVIRLASLIEFRSSENVTRDYTGITTWSTVELGTGVLCACMPTMRLIFVRIWPNVFGSTISNSSGKQYNNYGRSTGLGSNTNKIASRSDVPFSTSARHGGLPSAPGGKHVSPQSMERIDSDDERIQLRSVSEVASIKRGLEISTPMSTFLT